MYLREDRYTHFLCLLYNCECFPSCSVALRPLEMDQRNRGLLFLRRIRELSCSKAQAVKQSDVGDSVTQSVSTSRYAQCKSDVGPSFVERADGSQVSTRDSPNLPFGIHSQSRNLRSAPSPLQYHIKSTEAVFVSQLAYVLDCAEPSRDTKFPLWWMKNVC